MADEEQPSHGLHSAVATAPPFDDPFWTDELEWPAPATLRNYDDDESREHWVTKLSGRQLDVLCEHFGFTEVTSHQRKPAIIGMLEQLDPFIVIRAFGSSVNRHAARDVARRMLPKAVFDACVIKDDEGTYDTTALLFALFLQDHRNLRTAFHMTKVQKHSFARMQIGNPPARPGKSMQDWLTTHRVTRILKAVDMERSDGMPSELREIVSWDGSVFVFIRRGIGQRHVINDDNRIVHGRDPEWIVLQFSSGGDQVRICSKSNAVPLIIANEIASGYYGEAVEYTNQVEVTYAKQIEFLFKQLTTASDNPISLLQIAVNSSPLRGGAKLVMGASDHTSFIKSLVHFNEAIHGNLVARISSIDHIKVGFMGKKVDLTFDPEAGEPNAFIVRYGESRLSLVERARFEDSMRETYEITAISKERRFKNCAT